MKSEEAEIPTFLPLPLRSHGNSLPAGLSPLPQKTKRMRTPASKLLQARSTLPFLTSLQNGVLTEFEPLVEEYFSSSHTTLKPRVFLVGDVFLHYSVHVAAQVVVAQLGWNRPISLLPVD